MKNQKQPAEKGAGDTGTGWEWASGVEWGVWALCGDRSERVTREGWGGYLIGGEDADGSYITNSTPRTELQLSVTKQAGPRGLDKSGNGEDELTGVDTITMEWIGNWARAQSCGGTITEVCSRLLTASSGLKLFLFTFKRHFLMFPILDRLFFIFMFKHIDQHTDLMLEFFINIA